MVTAESYLVLSGILFGLGVLGVVIRRNVIVMFMCIELMLNAVNVSFVAIGRSVGNLDGQLFVFFVMTVAAAEAAVGLALIVSLYRRRQTVNADEVDLMKW